MLYIIIYTVGHKDGIFFFKDPILKCIAFFFGSFYYFRAGIKNDYVMIIEY